MADRTPEEIANGLTKVQREWLPRLVAEDMLVVANIGRPGCIHSAAALSLVNGLLARRSHFEVWPTALGHAVAAILRGADREGTNDQ